LFADAAAARITETLLALHQAAEQRLVAAAMEGDGDAYGALVARHQDIAFRAAFLITGSAADAQDAAQEALVKAWLALDRFRPEAPFRPWLMRIVINEARNRRRTAGRRAGLALRLAQLPQGPAPGAEAIALADEQRAGLLAAVGALSESDQLVIAARYFLELNEEETATALSWARGTVKSRLSRALTRLRKQLGELA
jgi:RNA polymerase sigma-70 factor (ECF subfamily)